MDTCIYYCKWKDQIVKISAKKAPQKCEALMAYVTMTFVIVMQMLYQLNFVYKLLRWLWEQINDSWIYACCMIKMW